MEREILILTAMHGRHDTVRYCYNKMKHLPVTFMYGYTLPSDGEFLENMLEGGAMYKVENQPLWNKFQVGVDFAKELNFDIAIMMGSDDYFDKAFLDYVVKQLETYDFVGFKDIYFEHGKSKYYWEGYTNQRQGEPCGAGKAYTKAALETLNWNLYRDSIDRGLDHSAWQRVKKFGLKCKLASVKQEGLMLCDVKDKESLTPLIRFAGALQSIS